MSEERIHSAIEISPEQRRQIQLLQLEMLIEIDRICRKHQIRYRLVGGTLIGAVRHRGFIPWDPDADISMSRSDYNRFFEVCKQELDTGRFFLQEWRTDPEYLWNYARLLRNDTTFVRAGHEELNSRNGIFVDIICVDCVPDSAVLRPIHCFLCFVIRKGLWSKVGKRLHSNRMMRLWYAVLSQIPRDWFFILRDWVIGWSDGKPTRLCRNMAHKVSPKSPYKWGYYTGIPIEEQLKVSNGQLPWNYFTTDLEFEGYKFMVSKFYEEGLRQTFGDYMTLPPKERRVSHIPCSKLGLVQPDIADYESLMRNVYTGSI